MKNVIIVGAGGLAREIYAYAVHCIDAGEKWQIKGFIDDNLNALDTYKYPVSVISTINDYVPQKDDIFILGVGIPSIKKLLVEKILKKGGIFASLIHPTAVIGFNVEIGEGVVIFPNTVISADVKIGDYVYINSSCTLDHDSSVGEYSTLCCGCDLTGHVKVGNLVFLSSHVTTVPNTQIGDNTFVGINSFVVGKIKPNIKILGNPASEKNYRNWKSKLDT